MWRLLGILSTYLYYCIRTDLMYYYCIYSINVNLDTSQHQPILEINYISTYIRFNIEVINTFVYRLLENLRTQARQYILQF